MARALPPSFFRLALGTCPNIPPLDGSRRADVCIVGGGFTGLSAALHLAEAGADVVLVEAERDRERRLGAEWRADPFRPAPRRALARGEIRLRACQDPLGPGGGGEGAAPRAHRPLRHHLRPPRRRHRGAAQAVADAARRRSWWKRYASRFGYDQVDAARSRRDDCGARLGALLRRHRSTAAAAISTPTAFRSGLARAAAGLGAAIHENTPAVALGRTGARWCARRSGEVRPTASSLRPTAAPGASSRSRAGAWSASTASSS